MKTRSKSISAVLNCHREGDLLGASLASVLDSLRVFDASGSSWELLCVADRSDDATLEMLRGEVARPVHKQYDIRVLPADFGDLALSRNFALENARGEFIAFVDGDDLVSRNWLTTAYRCARQHRGCIIHPECNLYFGATRAFMVHRNQDAYDLRALFFHNLWTALCFAPTEIYRRLPYQPNSLETGFGYEDWHWNCETIANGVVHRIAPGTCHFIRIREASLSRESVKNECVIRPTILWKHLVQSGSSGPIDVSLSKAALPDLVRSQGDRRFGSWGRLAAGLPPPPDGTLGARLYHEPDDIAIGAMPEWVRTELRNASGHDPAVSLPGNIFNFSPILPNPFVPALPDSVMAALSGGIGTVYFLESPAALSRIERTPSDLVILENGRSRDPRVISLGDQGERLGSKYDLFIASLIVQGACRRLEIHDSPRALGTLGKYWKVLSSSLREIRYFETRPCPPEWESFFEREQIVRVRM